MVGEYCPILFGTAAEGSSAPPYGSGTLNLYDAAQTQYTATYTASSFEVSVKVPGEDDCVVSFAGPELNFKSVGGLHKLVQSGPPDGDSCPSSDQCYQSYWVANASDVLIALDAAANPGCAALVFQVAPGGTYEKGGLKLIAQASGGAFDWDPAHVTGEYDITDVYWNLTFSMEGCRMNYRVDPDTLALVSFSDGAIEPGTASVAFSRVSSDSCPTACFTAGYNAIWDATGAPPALPLPFARNGALRALSRVRRARARARTQPSAIRTDGPLAEALVGV
jgi:hypothetical protein